jgi:hypothetical protein
MSTHNSNGRANGADGAGKEEEEETSSSIVENTQIDMLDIIRVPKYDRVWQIGRLGEVSEPMAQRRVVIFLRFLMIAPMVYNSTALFIVLFVEMTSGDCCC